MNYVILDSIEDFPGAAQHSLKYQAAKIKGHIPLLETSRLVSLVARM